MTIKDIEDCVEFPGDWGEALRGIIRYTYKIALSKGKTEKEALTLAADSLGEQLDIMYNKMLNNDTKPTGIQD